jgi:hypothetical protein
MSNDVQKEAERIHRNIVESLSFSEALANRDAEIARLRKELEGADRVANGFAQTACQRGARMQVMREWMECEQIDIAGAPYAWDEFVNDKPEAADWFDDEGVPR